MSQLIVYSVFSLVIVAFLFGAVIIILDTIKITQSVRTVMKKLEEENHILLTRIRS
jgi:hypothetical protein